MWKITKGNVTFASAFHDPSSKDCKQSRGGPRAPRNTQIKRLFFPTEN